MKVLHFTYHDGTILNINNVFNYLNINDKLETIKCNWPIYLNEDTANNLWNLNENFFKKYNTIIFTDTSMIARPLLQNLDKHNLNIIIYITNRFDWGIFNLNDKKYYDLYKEASYNNRVRFCSDNRYDQYYAKLHGIKFFYDDIINLTPKLFFDIKSKLDKFFIYDRGTKLENYKNFLNNNNILYDVFSKEKNKPFKNQEQICEYLGYIHLPYQTNIQSLYENLGYGIIYILPSKKFIKELIYNTNWYYWEEKSKNNEILENSIEYSEWYQKENEKLFIYFDNWDEILLKVNETNLIEKKKIIENHIIENNNINIKKWEKILEF